MKTNHDSDKPMNATTARLITLCRAGDEAAIESLVSTHQRSVYRLALSILEDPQEAEEAAQDTLIAALAALDTYRGDSAFTTWLHTITVNVCYSRLRKRRTLERLKNTLQSIFRTSGERLPHPEQTLIQNESETAIWNAVHKLGDKHRLPILLRYYHDYSVTEISQILGINEGTVHSRLSIARERLRSILGEERLRT